MYNSYKSFASCDALPAPISLFITPNLDKVPAKLLVVFDPELPSCCKRRFPSVLLEEPAVTLEVIGVVVFFVYAFTFFCGFRFNFTYNFTCAFLRKGGDKSYNFTFVIM